VPGTSGAWHFILWWRWRDLNPRPENWVRDIYERSRLLGSRPARRGRPRGAWTQPMLLGRPYRRRAAAHRLCHARSSTRRWGV